jgi:hypothetical protein
MKKLTLLIINGISENSVREDCPRIFKIIDELDLMIVWEEWKGTIIFLETSVHEPSIIFGAETMMTTPVGSRVGTHMSGWSAFGTRAVTLRCLPVYDDAIVKVDGSHDRHMVERRLEEWLFEKGFLATLPD